MPKENLYVSAYDYAESCLSQGRGVSPKGLADHLQERGHNLRLDSVEGKAWFKELYHQITGSSCDPEFKNGGTVEWPMKVDSFFSLLEYKELTEARRSAKQALWISAVAMFLTLVGMATSAYFGYVKLNTPIRISPEQVGQVVGAIPEQEALINAINAAGAANNSLQARRP